VTAPALSKASVLQALRARLEHDHRTAAQAQHHTQRGATHEESRPENDKDTRALEASYLARGQAQRVIELERSLHLLGALELRSFGAESAAALGALVQLEDAEGRATYFFIAPSGGGLDLEVGALHVRVVTPESPLGHTLIGRRPGECVEVRTPRGSREYEIVSMS
jgi:transcription elongation GreA/GreB family factor